jgi:hypothetical protein
MTGDSKVDETQLPQTPPEASSWLRILAREINIYVLFLQTWSAMGFLVSPELVSSLLELQQKVMEARPRVMEANTIQDLQEDLLYIATREEEVFNRMMEEIKKFKEETEDVFPALKLNFDPCF